MPHGFALVVTLSLMILITVVAVGLLGLSAVSLRTSSQGLAQAEARANARLALMIAIGELQKQFGPDQRISANSSILDTDSSKVTHLHWTGAWDSWKAGLGETSQHSTISGVAGEMAPKYQPNRKDYFRSWLLSLDPGEASEIETARNLALTGTKMPSASATAVQLVADGSLGTSANTADFVSARLLDVDSSATGSPFRGRYGWWVGDESQKARLMDDSHTINKDDTLAARLSRQQAPGSMGTRTIKGLENFTNEQQLASLPSLLTVGLINGATKDAALNFHSITPFSWQVLADVREGGLKRDLSTLLERPINPGESTDEFMLYRFSGSERVPIQDLAAYYQLYQAFPGNAADGNRGAQYSSAILRNGIQIPTPDYGGSNEKNKFHRQYSGLYRSAVPIKLQLLLGMLAKPRPPAEITAQSPESHELYMSTTLSITLWNPTNLPLVMDNSGQLSQRIRWYDTPFSIQWIKNAGEFTRTSSLAWAMSAGSGIICELDISRDKPLVFEPGEVKVLSIPYQSQVVDFQRWDNESRDYQNLKENWDANGFLTLPRTARAASGRNEAPHIMNHRLLFSADDQIQLKISADQAIPEPMVFTLSQDSYQDKGLLQERAYHHYRHRSRRNPPNSAAALDFNKSLMARGFPGQVPFIDVPSTSGTTIIASTRPDPVTGKVQPYPFMAFSLMAGAETHESTNAGPMEGRKFSSRPFLHSSAINAATIDADHPDSFYNYGWNWWIEPINSVLEANVQVTDDGKGYYGGGYGAGTGTNHVVQQEIPVVPPISIASLSHAMLGGFSLAEDVPLQIFQTELEPQPLAVGKGGLFPHTLQAIGNAYAHPQLAADKAYSDDFQRIFDSAVGAKSVVFADHSYLANKALWDEFFFSSITPQPASVKAFGGNERSAKQVANDFFFNEKPLPNRRIAPYTGDLDQTKLNTLFSDSEYQAFTDGLADKIAAHLLVEGPFNINSTSVDAWKALLASLKGKPVAYLDKDKALAGVINPDTASTTGTPVSSFTMPNAKPGTGSSNPNDPSQWLGWRELNDSEIEELAEAIVRQIKRRGPFLSLSEFVNRRLDGNNRNLSAKGALQAALDDPAVSINAGFRNTGREFSVAEISPMSPAFPEALDGPIAYGSAAYVDQADLLRNFAAQLTPRGDTFAIRTYGDALDGSNQVVARAWCEAVVQRVPDYSDSTDEPQVKQANLKSEANKAFGRRLKIISFRWLNSNEV